MKKIVVGDVHGCLDELLKLLEMVEVDPSDEVIFLGDVVDPNEIPEGAVYWDEKWAGPESVVMDEPRFVEVSKGDAIVLGIDTGCCFGGKLTAAVFMGRGGCPMVLSVPAAREYFPRRKAMDE